LGEQQRAVARALINKPNHFADEPSGNLDTASAKFASALFKLRDELGQTFVL
jgi:predicted ABC-type transport system involved in lysophospholipase L1 biosynthesis ATPase subunit